MAAPEKLLLDTCALIWFAVGHSRFTPEKAEIVKNAAEEDRLYTSVISLWELGYLERKGKITFQVPYQQFWDMLKVRINIKPVQVTEGIVLEFHSLHDQLHNDPGDRFIVGTAIRQKCTLVTGDLKLISWAKAHNFPHLFL